MRIAQLVERCLAKAKVAGSIPVSHSNYVHFYNFGFKFMKSFVSQGKTILDAIDKALIIAEFPKNFTVKILETGERSLFWWQNKAAIILFFYDVPEIAVDNKKKLKKNYSKEDAFINKKVTNHFQEAEYTSVIKSEKNIPQEKPFLNKNKSKGESNLQKADKEITSHQKHPSISNNEPQSVLGAALQNKTVGVNTGIQKNKKNHTIPVDKNISKNDDMKDHGTKEWKKEYVVFVEQWINELNKNFNFSNEVIIVNTEAETLFVKMQQVNDCDFVSKKHLFSSIVVVLYETLRSHFLDFDFKYYKIVLE